MGLPSYIAQMMFAENAFRPINGDVGFIGRQTTFLRQNSLEHLSRAYNFVPRGPVALEFDNDTRSSKKYGGNFLTDRTLMNYLGAKSFKAIDVSDYEGADIVADLSREIPKELHGSFDFIYDGSCLDNIFNPAIALTNISRLLRSGGRAILMNHATWFNGPYTIFSPGWFFDYFVYNKYADCQVFLGAFTDNKNLHFGPLPFYYFNWAANRMGIMPDPTQGTQTMTIVFIEKGADSTDDVSPVQQTYRDPAFDQTTYRENAERILRSSRRLFSLPQDLLSNKSAYIQLPTLSDSIPF